MERKKSTVLTILTLALLFMFVLTFLAAQVIMWQSQDISVAINSETEEGSKEVTISVLNTAGSTLLFYENDEITGKIEYLSDQGWIEYCDISYTEGNETAVSQLYKGTFAELEPGENWNVIVPEEKVSDMKSGTYRIKMTYITEKNYNRYLDDELSKLLEGSKESLEESVEEESEDEIGEESEQDNGFLRPIFGNNAMAQPETSSSEQDEFLASSYSEVFVKVFEYEIPEDFVSEISFENISDGEYVPENVRMRKTEELY
jgi:hypothetical protein